MLDFGALPPEINSTRMYAGPGSAPMVAAAAAWDVLANGLETASRGYSAVIAQLEGESWTGSAAGRDGHRGGPVRGMAGGRGGPGRTGGQPGAGRGGRLRGGLRRDGAARAGHGQPHPPGATGREQPPGTEHRDDRGDRGRLRTDVGPGCRRHVRLRRLVVGRDDADAVPRASADHQRRRPARASRRGRPGHERLGRVAISCRVVPDDVDRAAEVAKPLRNATFWRHFDRLRPRRRRRFQHADGAGESRRRHEPHRHVGGHLRHRGLPRQPAGGERSRQSRRPAAAASVSTGTAGVAGPTLASTGSASAVGRLSVPQSWAATNPTIATVAESHWLSDAELDGGPSWHEGPATNMWGGAPAAGAGASSALLSRPSVNNVLRVAPRQFKMPRPSAGG